MNAGPPPSPDSLEIGEYRFGVVALPSPQQGSLRLGLAMARERNHRYENAGDLSSAILAWLDGAERRLALAVVLQKLIVGKSALRNGVSACLSSQQSCSRTSSHGLARQRRPRHGRFGKKRTNFAGGHRCAPWRLSSPCLVRSHTTRT